MSSRRLLTRAEDIHCVAFHLVLMAGYALAFWLWLNPEIAGLDTTARKLAFAVGAGVMLGWCSGINVGVNFHNHVHRPIFRVEWLNRWFGRLWTVSGGWPAFFWAHSHVVVHHDNLLGPTDWTLPKRRADGGFENIYWYSFATWPWRYGYHLWRDFRAGRGGPGVGRTALVELLIFLPLWAAPFLIDWKMGLGLWLFPQWFANAFVMGPGMYAQHADCEPESHHAPLSHSNTFVQRFFNFTMFNIGYHIEHHTYPNVHWSALPRLHDRIKAELIRSRSHVVPFGYYRAGRLLCRRSWSERADEIWKAQHPEYRWPSEATQTQAEGTPPPADAPGSH